MAGSLRAGCVSASWPAIRTGPYLLPQSVLYGVASILDGLPLFESQGGIGMEQVEIAQRHRCLATRQFEARQCDLGAGPAVARDIRYLPPLSTSRRSGTASMKRAMGAGCRALQLRQPCHQVVRDGRQFSGSWATGNSG